MQILTRILAVIALGGFVPLWTYAQSSISTDLESPTPASRWKENSWRIKTGMESRSEGKDDGVAATFILDSKMNFELTPWMKIQLAPYANFLSSRVQERFDDDTYDSRIGLSYGHLTIEPLNEMAVKLGAISTRSINNKQMISSFRSFPGVSAAYTPEIIDGLKLGAEVQYLIPTSSSLNTDRQDQEELPSFQTQALVAEIKALGTTSTLKAGAFSWDNLPAKVAINSTRAGNLPANGDLDSETRFRYGFSGWFANATSEWESWKEDVVGVGYKRFSNTQAPANYADSQNVEVYGKFWTGDLGWGGSVGQFFSEAHATPASYASSSLGNTNRSGSFIEAGVDIQRYQFAIKASYVVANVINENPYQDDMTNLTVWVETYEFKF